MATIESREAVDEIIRLDGYDGSPSEDLRIIKIVEYTSNWNNTCYGLLYAIEVGQGISDRYEQPTQYVRNPKVIWTCTDYKERY